MDGRLTVLNWGRPEDGAELGQSNASGFADNSLALLATYFALLAVGKLGVLHH